MQYAIYVASGRRVFADAMYKRTMPTLPVGLKAHGYLHYVHPVLQTLLILNYQFLPYDRRKEKEPNLGDCPENHHCCGIGHSRCIRNRSMYSQIVDVGQAYPATTALNH